MVVEYAHEMKHDIRNLDGKINRLIRTISELAKLPPGFGTIIHQPGWTTISEWALVETGIDSLQDQVETAAEHCKQLLRSAELVGASENATTDSVKHMEDAVFKLIQAGNILDTKTLKKGERLIQESDFLREYMKGDRTFAGLSRAAKELNKQLQALSAARHPLVQEGGGGGGVDTSGAEQFAAGCAVVAAVAAATGAEPIAAAFGIASAIAQAVAVFAKSQ